MRTDHDVFLQPFPSFRDGFHPYLLETGYFPAHGICFAQWEELCEERLGAFIPGVDVLFLVKPLSGLPQQGEEKQPALDDISGDTPYHNGIAKLQKVVLASFFGLPQNGLDGTMLMRLNLSSKFTSPTLMLGPVATLVVEGTENSRRVFSAIASGIMGALELGFFIGRVARGGATRGCDLLTSFSRFSV